ncbi:hypothetical protein WMF11_44720 [Sorangium sp. So ce295]|uniref:hypothetical protein n=1 Tax=Sorangium sp. So ce295 TaxID=3133295 RepID=UPI003F6335CD
MTSSGVAQLRQYKPSRLTIVFRTRERCGPSLVLAASDRFASDGERLDPRERDIARRFRLAARDYPFPARLGRRLPEGAGLVEPYRHRAVAALRRLDRGAAPIEAHHRTGARGPRRAVGARNGHLERWRVGQARREHPRFAVNAKPHRPAALASVATRHEEARRGLAR